eukprot:CAMPEP_0117599052 /NCGR_PEP_ID=MMETSP0784-20121206/75735_1 /TAXON_ID=39447 /ORGANISM="" /LENGTH=86 /DNA_ID=CAMNT_0005401565 /DNA_START=1197 /DNA_END=1453 /DNA_ORIENTATION=+
MSGLPDRNISDISKKSRVPSPFLSSLLNRDFSASICSSVGLVLPPADFAKGLVPPPDHCIDSDVLDMPPDDLDIPPPVDLSCVDWA